MVFEALWKDGMTRDSVAKALRIPTDEIESLLGELLVGSTPQPVARHKPALKVV